MAPRKETSKMILESDIEKYLVKKFGSIGKVFKWVSPGIKGVPDRIIFLPGGKILLVELKRPKSKPRATQIIIHKMLARLGTKVWVVDSKEGVDKLYELHV